MVWAETVSGLIGGAAGIFVTHPLDTVRIRAQAANNFTAKPTYVQIARDIVKQKGFKGFFAGVTPPVALRGLGFAINRTSYGIAKKYTNNPLLLGSIAGFWQGVCECPVHLVKVRAQVGNSKVQESLWHYMKMFATIIRTERITGLYTGFVASSIFYVGSYGLFYVVYDEMRAKDYSPILAGPTACFLSWPLFYPFDVMRTRTQVVSKETRWARQYWTFRRVGKQMLDQNYKAWFPGMGLTLFRAIPRFGVAMFVCEETKKKLDLWE